MYMQGICFLNNTVLKTLDPYNSGISDDVPIVTLSSPESMAVSQPVISDKPFVSELSAITVRSSVDG